MKRFMAILGKGFSLIVDDGRLAAATVFWLLLAWGILPHLAIGTAWLGPILFVGLAVILLENTIHRSGRPG